MYSTDFEARKAIINKLGGDTVNLTNIFQCELVILALYGGDPSDVNNIFEADKKILTLLGGDVSGVTSVFDARKAIITQLGGDASLVNSLISASEMEMEYASIKEDYPPYVTFTAEEAGSTFGLAKKHASFTILYSEDNQTWENLTTASTVTLTNIGDKVYVRGKLTANLSVISYTLFKMTGKIAVSGSCKALWNYEDLEQILLSNCGRYLFSGCTSLTKAPELPSTTLSSSCYAYMFLNCTSLTKAPELPATSLSTSCYSYMFYGCSSLTSIKCLATNISASSALTNWTNGVASSGVFYKVVGVDWRSGTAGIPSGWEVKTVGHTITFANWDGTILQTIGVADGQIPVYNGPTPTRPFDGQYNYIFNGWSPTIAEATQDITYIASYTQIKIPVGNYVAFMAEEAGSTIQIVKQYSDFTLLYSKDTQNWLAMSESTPITLENIGDLVYVRGKLTTNLSNKNYTLFAMTGKIAASGNCNALWDYENLEAPLKEYCGKSMFLNCTALTQAPELPATSAAFYCYGGMFNGCTSLTTAPELPATGLAPYCYSAMFGNCTSLTKAPELPATSIYGNSCYGNMFLNCTSLTQAPELPATTLFENCYSGMFNGCTSLTTAPELPATILANYCYASMFKGCKSLTKAPELPASTLTKNSYAGMFDGCSTLTQAPELPAMNLAEGCYYNMFLNCTALTQAPKLPATTLIKNCYYSMFKGCSKLSSINCLATDITATSALSSWTNGVASTGTFCKVKGVEWPTGTSGIPTGWTIVETEDINTLALEFQTDGTLNIAKVLSSSDFQPNISMSVNSTSNWQTFGGTLSFGTFYNFTKGTVVYFKGNNPDGLNKSNTDYIQFATTGTVAAFGSVMSLIDDGVGTTTTIPNERCFAELFRNTTITRAPKLPATELTRYCYLNMFRSCTSLIAAPDLPAETLAPNCYQSMFNGCTKLVDVSLPATTLAPACYNQTFSGCTSLTSVILPAATLVDSCYNQMFLNCSALNRIDCYATDISAPNAVNNWMDGVASSGNFYIAAGVEWPTGTSGTPSGWRVWEL